MRRNAVVFLEIIFFGVFFGRVWGNLGKNPSHPQELACSTYGEGSSLLGEIISWFSMLMRHYEIF